MSGLLKTSKRTAQEAHASQFLHPSGFWVAQLLGCRSSGGLASSAGWAHSKLFEIVTASSRDRLSLLFPPLCVLAAPPLPVVQYPGDFREQLLCWAEARLGTVLVKGVTPAVRRNYHSRRVARRAPERRPPEPGRVARWGLESTTRAREGAEGGKGSANACSYETGLLVLVEVILGWGAGGSGTREQGKAGTHIHPPLIDTRPGPRVGPRG